MIIWNPWHGCHKISEGCEHCYMRCLLSLQAALPLLLTEIFQSAIIYEFYVLFLMPLMSDFFQAPS